eukprot:EG_transcript_25794
MEAWLARSGRPSPLPLPATPRVLLGRDPFLCDVVVCPAAEAAVGLVHALVVRAQWGTSDEALYIADLGSPAGTFVNGERLHARRPHALQDGDRVAFSSSDCASFHFHCVPSHRISLLGGTVEDDLRPALLVGEALAIPAGPPRAAHRMSTSSSVEDSPVVLAGQHRPRIALNEQVVPAAVHEPPHGSGSALQSSRAGPAMPVSPRHSWTAAERTARPWPARGPASARLASPPSAAHRRRRRPPTAPGSPS